MSYDTTVTQMRECYGVWVGDDGDRPNQPRAILIEGGPLVGDEVMWRGSRVRVRKILTRYQIEDADGTAGRRNGSVTGFIISPRDLSPAPPEPDPREIIERARNDLAVCWSPKSVKDALDLAERLLEEREAVYASEEGQDAGGGA